MPLRIIHIDQTSLRGLPSRKQACFGPKCLLTSSQNRYLPALYLTWMFFGSPLLCY